MGRDAAISLAIESILRDGLSDITRESLELGFIEKYKDVFFEEIKSKLNRNAIHEMEFKPVQHVLTPKNRFVFDYRKAAVITPTCLAKYLAIVFQYAEIVEKARVPSDKNIVFSCRFKPDSSGVFDRTIGYSEWRSHTKKMSESGDCSFVVSCDIAAFYDRVNIHRIESTLLSIGVPERLVRFTNDLLLFWSRKDSYGLPVGNIASRILAEAALIDIDQYLLAEKITFTRYVDDYRLFAPSLLIAQEWMNKLTVRLFRDGLMLNTGKTHIKKVGTDLMELKDDNKDEAEKVLKEITKLTGGYNKISRKFLMPAESKHEKFLEINLNEEIERLNNASIVEFQGIQKVIVASLVQKRFDALLDIANICCQYLYGLDYFVDMLIKNAEFIPEEYREKFSNFYEALIESGDLYSFEWHCASLASLLSHPSYYRKNALLKLFKAPAKDVTTYASVMALEGLQGRLTRTEFRTIREYFERSDEWERRRLLSLSDALPRDERRAWAKSVKPSLAADYIGLQMCEEIIRS